MSIIINPIDFQEHLNTRVSMNYQHKPNCQCCPPMLTCVRVGCLNLVFISPGGGGRGVDQVSFSLWQGLIMKPEEKVKSTVVLRVVEMFDYSESGEGKGSRQVHVTNSDKSYNLPLLMISTSFCTLKMRGEGRTYNHDS